MIAAHVALRGREAVRPTARMLRLWWGRLNREVFDGALWAPKITFGPSDTPEVLGLCYALPAGRVRIHIDSRCATREDWLATLAHEMVHQFQHQHGAEMTHGPSFTRWAIPVAEQTGLLI